MPYEYDAPEFHDDGNVPPQIKALTQDDNVQVYSAVEALHTTILSAARLKRKDSDVRDLVILCIKPITTVQAGDAIGGAVVVRPLAIVITDDELQNYEPISNELVQFVMKHVVQETVKRQEYMDKEVNKG